MSDADIDAILRSGGSRRRWLLLPAVAIVVVVAVVVAFWLTSSESSDVVTEPQRAEAFMDRLSTEVVLSGSASSERSATLSFEVAGLVASVAVSQGDNVREGDALATLDDTDAQRRIETAEVQLRQAQLRLDSLLTDPEPSAVASANQAIASAKSQIVGAEQALALLSDPPSAADLASAEQAVASALGQISSTEQALALLSEPPSAADLASAEQAVATALGQISSAEQALALLSEPPSTGDLANAEQAVANALGQISSAEQALALLSEPPSAGDLADTGQAVANALGQLSSAEQDLAELIAGPSEAGIAESRSAVTQAQIQLTAATTLAEELMEALTEAFDGYCDRYSGLIASDAVISETCTAALPLTDAQVETLRDSFEDRSSTYETFGNSLIDANVAFVASDADRESAISGLSLAEESLTNLLQSITEDDLYQAGQAVEAARASHTAAVAKLEDLRTVSGEEDVYQAEQAVEAARASHTAAVARLEDLRTVSGEEDVYQAEQAVEAAKASHTAAVARLEDLQTVSGEEDVYQAEQAVEAAKASHTAAVARLEDLRAAVDEGDIEQARASLESAQASLASAEAHYNELVSGPSENAIAQQEQEVRLAELSVEEARGAMAELTVFAPFDGVVEALSVQPGDRISAGSAAFTLNTSNRMLIALTVTEEDLLDLEIGQAGLASFDAIDGIEYPVQVVSISRVPNSEQGVVTYDVEARILAGSELAEVARDSTGSGIGAGGGFGRGPASGLLAGFELPEGVTLRQVAQALVSGDPLPEGVVIPEELKALISERGAEALQRFASTGRGPGTEQAPAGQPGASVSRPLPAPGMSGSVTILTEVREQSVMVPVSAVRQLDGAWFVNVPAPSQSEAQDGFERIFVEVGESDGTNVEIVSGIDAGTVVLIGADNSGIAFTATQQQPRAIPGQGGFGPGGGRGGQ